jgi:hypothetical protein
MEMGCTLPVELTFCRTTILGGTEPLETFLDNRRVFAMIIGMHLDIRGADVNLVTTRLEINDF